MINKDLLIKWYLQYSKKLKYQFLLINYLSCDKIGLAYLSKTHRVKWAKEHDPQLNIFLINNENNNIF